MTTTSKKFTTTNGSPFPYGVSLQDAGINFSLASTSAQSITLCIIDRETKHLIEEIPLSQDTNKTGNVWHILLQGLGDNVLYAYKITDKNGKTSPLLLDPYAKGIGTTNEWGKNIHLSPNQAISYHPLGEIILNPPFSWDNDRPPRIPLTDLILYEMHVRGFTHDASSNVSSPGTYLGIIEKIPYLLDLGVNAIELMPIFEFNELEYLETHKKSGKDLYNYWGYSTINFFSPMNRYATSEHRDAAIHEFKTMVKELHKNGIEVILDVVYNHTGEGGETGPTYSFKGIDKAVYYMLDEEGDYRNYSGCGNTVNANYPSVTEMIIDSLRYWVTEMHVDGFRFDLASALTRGTNGEPLSPAPLIKAIENDPILAKVKLIAEPWDAAGLYQVGHFASGSKRWSEWNGKYRDDIRRFIRGSSWTSGKFAMRICGSEDLFKQQGPLASLNFITCHDGFTLNDLVSYNVKHNLNNGEDNRDGENNNESWNCGVEGPTTNKKILQLREKQMKNFHFALMISLGVPMLYMGDEYGHTKDGNNNTWCQDNTLNWFLWNELKEKQSFFRFYRLMIQFRKSHQILRRKTFLTNADIDWHGHEPFKPDWNSPAAFVAFTLKQHHGDGDLYIAFNAQEHGMTVELPPPPHLKSWRWVINTNNPSPEDFYEDAKGPLQLERNVKIPAHTAILLKS